MPNKAEEKRNHQPLKWFPIAAGLVFISTLIILSVSIYQHVQRVDKDKSSQITP